MRGRRVASTFARLLRSSERSRTNRRDSDLPRDYVAEELRRRRERDLATEGQSDDGRSVNARSQMLAVRVGASEPVIPSDLLRDSGSEGVPVELASGIEPAVLRMLTPQLAREFRALPLRIDSNAIVFAVDREPTYKLQNELRWLVNIGSDRQRTPLFEHIAATLLTQSLDIYYPHQIGTIIPGNADLIRLFATDGAPNDPVLRATNEPLSVRELVDTILMKAVYRGANDILFECFDSEFRVRFKVEGECEYAMTPLPPGASGQIISIVKQHAKLDIAETERSQDGRFDLKVECRGEIRNLQFRVATRPTVAGEGCVVRLHDNTERRPRLASIGADARTRSILEGVRDHRGGLVLFSGPTGSGKTTTLAAILGECDSVRENIVTIEDPVEIRLPGITQSAVNEIKGETFGRLLRNTLRVAPDRILVGEIRDQETAQLVIKAALTGHQVLSTVHADDAPRSISRILEEGASPFNLASVVSIVVAQRLLNRLCEHCAEPVEYPEEVLAREQFNTAEFDAVRARESHGCSMCYNRGTFGRIGIFETLVVSDEIRDLIARRPFNLESVVRDAAIRAGMRPLRRCGLDLVRTGTVSLQQVADVTPYIPSDALRTVWLQSQSSLQEELVLRPGDPSATRIVHYAGPSRMNEDSLSPSEAETLDVIRSLIDDARRDADAAYRNSAGASAGGRGGFDA